MKYYGTLGSACADQGILERMFACGMTGLRLNTSHSSLASAMDWILMADRAASAAGCDWQLLIDLVGPELRIGRFEAPLSLTEGQEILLRAFGQSPLLSGAVPVPAELLQHLTPGQFLLLDDGKIRLKVMACKRDQVTAKVIRGGLLLPSKSLAIEGREVHLPALTAEDLENIRFAGSMQGLKGAGIRLAAVMQPFVRSRADLLAVRQALDSAGLKDTLVMAKIESREGVRAFKKLLPAMDYVVIARGDLGTSVGLTKLPSVQRYLETLCHREGRPYMIVTQLLDSMTRSPVPTRAEVSDIAHAVYDGADSLMLTGETAVGAYPEQAMRCLVETAGEALSFRRLGERMLTDI